MTVLRTLGINPSNIFIHWLSLRVKIQFSIFQVNIDPETLKPKLPSRKDLKPYPVACYLEYKGHKGAVVSISTEASGQWFASGLVAFLFLCFRFGCLSERLHIRSVS